MTYAKNTRRLQGLGLIAVTMAWIGLAPPTIADPLHRAAGNHIRLTTDQPADEAAVMVTSFDAAVNLWAEKLGVSPAAASEFMVDALVMGDQRPFENAMMIPPGLPNFSYGYALGNRLFVRSQPSRYYTRHLLLHEGVHAFVMQYFDSMGPTWFMEGTAEWLATHRGSGAAVAVGVMPEERAAYPYWGRFKMIEILRDQDELPTIETVMRYAPTLAGDIQSYACSWAAMAMIQTYPEYHELIQEFNEIGDISAGAFNRQFARRLAPNWNVFAARWALWLDEMGYAMDPARHQVSLSMDDPLVDPNRPTNLPVIRVDAARGWQAAGVRIAAGTTVRLSASGTATVADVPGPWTTHPRGVSLRYIGGRPIGQLLAATIPVQPTAERYLPRLSIRPIAPEGEIYVATECWLCLKINDSVGERVDNRGEYTVTLSP